MSHWERDTVYLIDNIRIHIKKFLEIGMKNNNSIA